MYAKAEDQNTQQKMDRALYCCNSAVNSYDVFFFLAISRIIYVFYQNDDNSNEENFIALDRIDPAYMSRKELFSLLERRGEVFNKNTERKHLHDLVKSKVRVERSDPPVLAELEKLSVKELKRLLDQRGIMYYSRSSKEDLILAVNISGPVTPEAVAHMKQSSEPEVGNVIEFNAFNVDKTLRKHNESIVVINILPPRLKYSHFNESSWKALRRKLSYMNFKFGELDCDFEKSICLRKKWNISTLFMYVPDKNVTTDYYIKEDYSIHSIFTRIQSSISHLITEITSWETMTSADWLFYAGRDDPVPVRVVLFTNMTRPPMFLSALSVKYRKQISFGMVNIESRKGRTILRKLKQDKRATCLVITKTGILTYGKLPGEFFTYSDFEIFLRNLLRDFKPEVRWYHKIAFLLDPVLIVILCIRVASRHACNKMLRDKPDKSNQEANESTEEDKRGDETEEQHRQKEPLSQQDIARMFYPFLLAYLRRQQARRN